MLWDRFIDSFTKNVSQISSEKNLSVLWGQKSEMTTFYKEELFPRIAKDLGLHVSPKESLRLDIMLYAGESYPVPIIFVESENDPHGELDKEIQKLLCVNAPLKILLTRMSLSSVLKAEFDKHEDSDWYYPLQDFAEFNRLIGYFAVIAAVWVENNLTYSYVVYDENGELLAKEFDKIIVK